MFVDLGAATDSPPPCLAPDHDFSRRQSSLSPVASRPRVMERCSEQSANRKASRADVSKVYWQAKSRVRPAAMSGAGVKFAKKIYAIRQQPEARLKEISAEAVNRMLNIVKCRASIVNCQSTTQQSSSIGSVRFASARLDSIRFGRAINAARSGESQIEHHLGWLIGFFFQTFSRRSLLECALSYPA